MLAGEVTPAAIVNSAVDPGVSQARLAKVRVEGRTWNRVGGQGLGSGLRGLSEHDPVGCGAGTRRSASVSWFHFPPWCAGALSRATWPRLETFCCHSVRVSGGVGAADVRRCGEARDAADRPRTDRTQEVPGLKRQRGWGAATPGDVVASGLVGHSKCWKVPEIPEFASFSGEDV